MDDHMSEKDFSVKLQETQLPLALTSAYNRGGTGVNSSLNSPRKLNLTGNLAFSITAPQSCFIAPNYLEGLSMAKSVLTCFQILRPTMNE